jgi:hypothetical protein
VRWHVCLFKVATIGGQGQGGISTPTKVPLILLFTGEVGEQYGYADGWTNDGLFLYVGEGQQGDMQFVRGNAAIRDHNVDGKDLHLFSYVRKGFVRYVGQMVCIGSYYQEGLDAKGNKRRMIVFELAPLQVKKFLWFKSNLIPYLYVIFVLKLWRLLLQAEIPSNANRTTTTEVKQLSYMR